MSARGQRYLGIYGKDEHGWVFHAVLDLAATPDDTIGVAAAAVGYEALAIWRLGPHDAIALDERLPAQVQAFHREAYDLATAEQTVVLLLTTAEVRTFALPEMQ